MYYTRALILITLLLGGCASTPQTVNNPESTANPGKTAESIAATEIAEYRQAITLLNNNQTNQARDILNTLATKHPELAGPWANLALIDIKNQKYDSAEENAKKAVSRDPNMPQAYSLLGYIAKEKGQFNEAIGYYQQAINADSNYTTAYYNLALIYDVYLQDIPSALKYYSKYLDLNGHQDKETESIVNDLKEIVKRGTL